MVVVPGMSTPTVFLPASSCFFQLFFSGTGPHLGPVIPGAIASVCVGPAKAGWRKPQEKKMIRDI